MQPTPVELAEELVVVIGRERPLDRPVCASRAAYPRRPGRVVALETAQIGIGPVAERHVDQARDGDDDESEPEHDSNIDRLAFQGDLSVRPDGGVRPTLGT